MALGVEKGSVLLVPYNEAWPELFQIEKELLQSIFKSIEKEDIQHIGSTAVPNLYAKPILDIAIRVNNIEGLNEEVSRLNALQYAEKVGRLPGQQRVFVKSKNNIVTHHLHLIEHGNPKWEEKINFRDLLRMDDNQRLRYQELKDKLFKKYKHERRKYTDGKADFIQEIWEKHRMKFHLSKEMVLSSAKFNLRFPSQEDIPHVFSATRVEGFNDGMLWDPPEKMEEIEGSLARNHVAWDEGRGFSFTIDDKSTNAFVGRIGIRKTKISKVWNIGFWTHPQHQGKGVMKEVVGRILHFAFTELQAIRVEADYATWNIASEKVLTSNGFQFVKFIENAFQKNGQWVDENAMAIDKAQWLQA